MPREKFGEKIRDALTAKHELEVTIGGHSIELYRAEYSQSGNPPSYFMKDSYTGYFYRAEPDRLHATLLEITTAVN